VKVILVVLLLLVTAVSAQTPDNDALFGTFGVRADAARIRLATNSTNIPVTFQTTTFGWKNGPPGDQEYDDHTWGFGYNTDFYGFKIVPNTVSYFFSNESKYRNGVAGFVDPPFMSEHYFSWSSPDGLINIRPFGFTVQYDTGNVSHEYHGEFNFFRHASNGGGQWGIWHDDGFLDLRIAPNGRIAFKNNVTALLWQNAEATNVLAPIYVDDQNRVVVGGGQVTTVINSQYLSYKTSVKQGDTKILGAQCAAIPDSAGGVDDKRAINDTLACLRSHGLVAQ